MPDPESSEPIKYSKKNPFIAKLTVNQRLTGAGSNKDTRHFVVDISGSRMAYTPGDSLAVTPQNPPALVEELIQALGFDPAAEVEHKRCGKKVLSRALTEDFIINRALKKILKDLPDRLPEGGQKERAQALLEDAEKASEYLFSRDYVDILKDFSEAKYETPEAFLDVLGPMLPRLYSIASSQAVHPNEVHLLIAIVRYETHGRPKAGMASGWLADYAELDRSYVPVFPTASKFRLPEDGDTDIIMVGPGTGVAPFRAYLEQREVDGAKGRNWLFFGEQHRASDFFYEDEWKRFQDLGLLTKLSLAFSRDQAEKVYVQHQMLENGREIWEWLQNGAYFYVCGDAERMAKDVNRALIDIAQQHGGLGEEAAVEYVEKTLMREEKRYRRDVY